MARVNISQIRAALLAATLLSLSGCSFAAQIFEDAAPEPQPTVVTPAPAPASPSPSPTPEESPPTQATYEQDPLLAQELSELITGELPLANLYASEDIAEDCSDDVAGCYVHSSLDRSIYVDATVEGFHRAEILAHEYLHYVWFRDDLEEDEPLTAALREAYEEPEGLGAVIPEDIESYKDDDGRIEPTELFAYACVNLRPRQLPAVISETCEEYVQTGELPVNRQVSHDLLLQEIARLREESGVGALVLDPNAVAASEARAELFRPYSQVPLDEYPKSVLDHLHAGCAPSTYGAVLTRPEDEARIAREMDESLNGLLTDPGSWGIGIATSTFDYIDSSSIFGEGTMNVNVTLIIATVCG